MNMPKAKKIISLVSIVFLLSTLFFTLDLVKKSQHYSTEAQGKPANLVVDTSVNWGLINPFWQALAQGGEESSDMIQPVVDLTRQLEPKYIRLDHLYDFYEVVSRQEGNLIFTWSKADQVITSLLKTGALPFISLSYMPPVIAQDGQITNPPVNWQDWQIVVRKTIEHYSGKNNFNLENVYYEVWNEPDLFGQWKIGGKKDYRQLYYYAAKGALAAQNVNSFKIGGPSTTALYQGWLDKFLEFVWEKQLPLDFYSWHKYSPNPEDFLKDINLIDNWLTKHGGYYLLPKYLTEWGSSSENSPLHDDMYDAAHLVAVARALLQKIDLAFAFEIRDGPSPEGKKYWGRWGLLTHDGTPKIKYSALQLLNMVKGNRLGLSGEGTWVSGFAAKDNEGLYLIITNLDQKYQHSETVPVTFTNLDGSQYYLKENRLTGLAKTSVQNAEQGILTKSFFLQPNEVLLLKLVKIS